LPGVSRLTWRGNVGDDFGRGNLKNLGKAVENFQVRVQGPPRGLAIVLANANLVDRYPETAPSQIIVVTTPPSDPWRNKTKRSTEEEQDETQKRGEPRRSAAPS